METRSVPEELLALRERIDAIDEEILRVLSRRFEATREVGQLKARENLDCVDPVREREKLDRLTAQAGSHSLNDTFVHELFQMIFREVVENHQSFRK